MASLGLTREYEAAIDREWARLAAPGTWLTGHQRVAIAAQARSALKHQVLDTPSATPPMVEAARVISAEASEAREQWVESLYNNGLDPLEYVEILGVVARLTAIDTFLFGIGHPERPLPEPSDGDPSREPVDGAVINGGWAPTVGPAGAPSALTAIDAERDAMFDIHSAFYLSLEEMGDMGIVKDLQRDQLETVAARTSLINDCFY